MATLKKYNLAGQEVGAVEIDDSFVNSQTSGQLIKDYIVALRRNARQWSANTKGRSEVSHSNKKPHRQKGTGNARQGSLAAPQYKGGGVVFGPKPKFDQHVRINKKERRAAIRALLAEKMREGRVFVLEQPQMDAPRTKLVADFLKQLEVEKRTLFMTDAETTHVGEGEESKVITVRSQRHAHFKKSLNNIPKVEHCIATSVSGYDMAIANNVVLTEEALTQLVGWLGTPKAAQA